MRASASPLSPPTAFISPRSRASPSIRRPTVGARRGACTATTSTEPSLPTASRAIWAPMNSRRAAGLAAWLLLALPGCFDFSALTAEYGKDLAARDGGTDLTATDLSVPANADLSEAISGADLLGMNPLGADLATHDL